MVVGSTALYYKNSRSCHLEGERSDSAIVSGSGSMTNSETEALIAAFVSERRFAQETAM
jgi:hypothetical protein